MGNEFSEENEIKQEPIPNPQSPIPNPQQKLSNLNKI